MIITITANRKLVPTDHDIIFQEMVELVTTPEIETIYFGGAIGGDTVALQSCLDICVLDRPKLIVVVPNRLQDQPKSTHAISRKADEIIELGNNISVSDGWAAYHKRNAYMVDRSSDVVAFWDGSANSGTSSCINYAKKLNKTIKIVQIIGEDK